MRLTNKYAMFANAALVAAALIALPAGANASTTDSPPISVFSGGVERCQATYYSGADSFDLADMSSDGLYCYIQYDWDSSVDVGGSRFSHPTDYAIGAALGYSVTVNGPTVWWKLCREIPSGPDDCTSVRSDAS